MTFLFDRCLAVRLVRVIAAYEVAHKVRYLDDHFDKNTSDVQWITAIAGWQEPPIVITADKRMRQDPVERKALAASKLTLVSAYAYSGSDVVDRMAGNCHRDDTGPRGYCI